MDWTGYLTLMGTAIAILAAIFGQGHHIKKELGGRMDKMDERFDKLDNKIDAVRDELKQDIREVRQELKHDIAKLDERVGRIENHLFVLRPLEKNPPELVLR